MQEFLQEAHKYVLSGQSAFYVNSREESRAIRAIRMAGWQLGKKFKVDEKDVAGRLVEIMTRLDMHGHASDVNKTGYFKPVVLTEAMERLDRYGETWNDRNAQDAQNLLQVALDSHCYPTVVWDVISGFSAVHGYEIKNKASDDFRAMMEMVGDIQPVDTKPMRWSFPPKCLIIVKDSHGHLNSENPSWRRAVRNVYEDDRLVQGYISRHIFFLQPYFRPHEDIRHCLVRLEFPLPRDEEIAQEVANAEQSSTHKCPDDLRVEVVSSLRGLDTGNIIKTLAYCIVDFGGFRPEVGEGDDKRRMVAKIRSMRSKQLSGGQGLRIIDPDDPELTAMGMLGGYENVRALAERVAFCRSKKARELKVSQPSGFAVAGPPGTGKTVCAKLFANWLGVPLCVVNMGTLKEGLVGASENNTANAIETIRAIGDCVVLFDEWDKQAGGVIGSATDGNTSSGMLSIILDFASDPRRRAFLIFTMNRLHGPIESLRAGRISRFFYTPLPDAVDREEILNLKLTENGATIPSGLKAIASDKCTADLSGSELNEMVLEAIALAAQRDGAKTPTIDDLRSARDVVTPVTKLNKEEIDAMMSFEGVAISVNHKKTKASEVSQIAGRRRIIVDNIDPSNN